MFKINQNHIDPLPLYDTGQLRGILGRDEVKVPDQQAGEGEEQYDERLRQVVTCLDNVFVALYFIIAHQRKAPLARKSSYKKFLNTQLAMCLLLIL